MIYLNKTSNRERKVNINAIIFASEMKRETLTCNAIQVSREHKGIDTIPGY